VLDAPGRPAGPFDPSRPWRLHPQVALRDEPFGALAYHYGTRRLVFLHSRALVELVRSLECYGSADDAIAQQAGTRSRGTFERALTHLAASGVIDAR
jgi:mycofactocin biosynthesis protein MftB